MRRLGLWKYFKNFHDEDNYYETRVVVPPNTMDSPEVSILTYHRDSEFVEDSRLHERRVAVPEQLLSADLDSIMPPVPVWEKLWNTAAQKYRNFTDTSHLPGNDYYLGIFVADLLVFFITIIFWTSFSGDYRNDMNIEFLYTV
jgi:hypothetical protein